MRILMFAAEGNVGGGKTHILSLATGLIKRCDFRLVCFRKGKLYDEAVELGIDTVLVDEAKGYPFAFNEAERLYKEFMPDIVHCHGPKSNLIGAVLKKRTGACIMSTVHSDPKLDYLGKKYKQYTFGTANLWALRHMDYIQTVSFSIREILTGYGYDPCRMLQMYNGFDFAESNPKPRQYKDEKDIVTIGILARLTPVKSVDTLIKAFSLASKKDSRLRLSIGGGGDEKPALEKLVKDLGVEDLVTFEGWVSDAIGYFNRIDINVLPSVTEGFPYSLIEGGYCHCPVIASNIGGIPELIEHGITGYLFNVRDHERLAELILKMAADQKLRGELGDNLYNKTRTMLSVEGMRQRQLEIYDIINRRQAVKNQRRGAVLCGAYGRGNVGDEAIMTAIVSELRHADPDMPIWVMSRNPGNSSVKGAVRSFHIFNVFSLVKALKSAELFVSGGGTLIQDVTSTRSLKYYLFTLKAAKKLGCKVIMYGCGIGPISSPANKRHAAKVLDSYVDAITLRDSSSMDVIGELGVSKPEIILTADPTLNLPRLSEGAVELQMDNAGLDKPGTYACFTIREWKGMELEEPVVKAAEYARDKYGLTPVFIAFESPRDDKITIHASKLCKESKYITSFSDRPAVLMGMLGRMEFVCGMRLHSLIFAVAAGTPVIGLSYDPKVSGLIRDIGSDAVIPIEKLNSDAICEQIDKLMAAKDRNDSEEKRIRMQAIEHENELAAARLLKEIRSL